MISTTSSFNLESELEDIGRPFLLGEQFVRRRLDLMEYFPVPQLDEFKKALKYSNNLQIIRSTRFEGFDLVSVCKIGENEDITIYFGEVVSTSECHKRLQLYDSEVR